MTTTPSDVPSDVQADVQADVPSDVQADVPEVTEAVFVAYTEPAPEPEAEAVFVAYTDAPMAHAADDSE